MVEWRVSKISYISTRGCADIVFEKSTEPGTPPVVVTIPEISIHEGLEEATRKAVSILSEACAYLVDSKKQSETR